MPMALDMAVTDIQKALQTGIYYAALVTTLQIPHLCSSLENENNRSNGEDYKKWYRAYVEQRFRGTLSGDACYSLRCGMSHQGQVKIPGAKSIRKVVFRLPDSNRKLSFHGNIDGFTVQYELNIFCEEFIAAAGVWWNLKSQDAIVRQNMGHLVRYHESANFFGMEIGHVLA